jgi:hypothetical protein
MSMDHFLHPALGSGFSRQPPFSEPQGPSEGR